MKNDRVRYLIVGNSVAAVAAVEAIRRLDREGSIRILSREPRPAYSRPLLPLLLDPAADPRRLEYRSMDFYKAHGVEVRLGLAAERVDPEGRVVLTPEGPVRFEKLLLACGGKPLRPAGIEGLNARGVFTFTDWDEAMAVRAWIQTERVRRAVVLGGGLIGIKAAEALHDRGLDVLIVELADRILPAVLDARASQLAAEAARRAGVELRCGTTVEKIEAPAGRVASVRLRQGEVVPCELVVAALGVTPNIDPVKGSAVRTDRGILVDDRGETTVPGIFAAGDVTQGRDALTGNSRPLPIFANAFWQGTAAGTAMAGGEPSLPPLFPMNAISIFGLPTISVGLATASGEDFEVLTSENEGGRSYRRVVLQGNRVVGALFAGNVDRTGIYTGLIRERVDVGGIKPLLLTDDLGLLRLPERYRKHLILGEGIEV